MLPYFTEDFGNPHSDSHPYGWQAANALERSRALVSGLISADMREIMFTSGATESCNIALRGIAGRNPEGREKIITVSTEHACILETCKALQTEGFEIVYLPVNSDGLVDLDMVRKAVDKKTLLVSVMLANNEIGVIQPVRDIARICQQAGVYMHSDATQAVGKIPVDVHALGVDFMSFSAHKFYGPKGMGALYVRWNNISVLQPLTTGGSQENGLRPGTVAVPLAVGFGEASRIAFNETKRDMAHTSRLTAMLYARLRDRVPEIRLFGHPKQRLPGNLNLGFPGFSGEDIVNRVSDHLAISTGSACSSSTAKVSHVLEALHLDRETANSAVRISVGRFNTEEEVKQAVEILIAVTRR